MTRRPHLSTAGAALLVLVVGGPAAASDTAAPAIGGGHLPLGSEPVELDPAQFTVDIDKYYAGEAEDNGEILSTAEQAEVPYGHFGDVVLTKDTITIEPDVLEYKLYARDVGPVLVLGVSGGGGREELVAVETVSEGAARAAGTTALGEAYP